MRARRWTSMGAGAVLGLGLALADAAPVVAQAPPLREYRHVRWDVTDGAPSRINALTQSLDGYLWIGGVDGLARFDGVAFEPVEAEAPGLRRMVVSALAAAPDGAVWVGLARGGGVAVWRDGVLRLAAMPDPSREVNDIALDSEGGVWVVRGGRARDTLARYADGRWRGFGARDGMPDQPAWQVLPTRDGAIWLVASDGVWRRPPGGSRFAPTAIRTTRRASLAQDASGGLWLSDARGVRRVTPEGAVGPLYPRASEAGGVRTLFDRAGGLWGADWNGGLFRIPSPGRSREVESYRAVDGLTSDQARPILQDREGSIWIGTELGLDMFRTAPVVAEPEIPANSPTSYRIAAARGGMVFVGDARAVYAIPPGGSPVVAARTTSPVEALCPARAGGVWAVLADRLVRIEVGVAERRPKPPEITALACAEDDTGRLWLPALADGLQVWAEGRWRRAADGLAAPAGVIFTPQDGLAVAYRQRPSKPGGDGLTAVYAERFGVGGVEGVAAGADGLYVGGAEGLARLRGGEVRRLSAETYPWLASVNGLVQTPAGETWTFGDAGLVRMRTADLTRAFARGGVLERRLFDHRDGLNSFAQKGSGDQLAVGGDGRLWVLTRRNVVRLDPARLQTNPVPPPVRIRAVTAGGVRYVRAGRVELPAGAPAVAFDYTALSLAEPSRVRFRYRLEGVDPGWIQAEGRRQASYSGLGPGRYRFQVTAANNDGVWNRTGDVVEIHIPPTLWESWWFRALLVPLALAGLWVVVRWRVRAATAAAEARLSERQAERLRIARDLHDTLLQGFQGLLVRFQVVANAIPADQPARPMMEAALDRAEEILVEGRDRVRDLRDEQDAGSLLVVELRQLAYELERDYGTPIQVEATGAVGPLNGDAHREVYAIAGEALVNAARHSEATAIVCNLAFERRRLVLEVRDNGRGLPPEILRRGGRDGHWGLSGMAERARLVGGHLRLRSDGAGTTVRLSAPMRLVRPRRASKPWRLGR